MDWLLNLLLKAPENVAWKNQYLLPLLPIKCLLARCGIFRIYESSSSPLFSFKKQRIPSLRASLPFLLNVPQLTVIFTLWIELSSVKISKCLGKSVKSYPFSSYYCWSLSLTSYCDQMLVMAIFSDLRPIWQTWIWLLLLRFSKQWSLFLLCSYFSYFFSFFKQPRYPPLILVTNPLVPGAPF